MPADGSYDTNGVFQMPDDKGRDKLKIRHGLPRQAASQGPDGRYAKRNKVVGYGRRTAVVGVFAVLKAFGEAMQARKAGNSMREILIKVLVYNRFVATLI